MTFFYYLLLFIFGLVFGSFVGMLTYRLGRRASVLGRSFCDGCGRKLQWYQNIPLLSYIFLKSCSSCAAKIPVRYFVIELLTGIIFLLIGIFWQKGTSYELVYFLSISVVLISLAVIDYEKKILPDILVYILGVLVFAPLLDDGSEIFIKLLSGFSAFIFFLAIYLITRGRGMGFGDVKLSFVLASFLSLPNAIIWVFLSFCFGAVVGIVLLIIGKASIGKPLPFGPYLIFSFWAAYFFGATLIAWYENFL